jgi:prepilin-type N-terminal cleavage/methylation domain-containing protein
MVRSSFAPRSARERGGFTLIELIISLTIGLIVVAASLGFAISTFEGAEGNNAREEVYRNARFIGMSLDRDVQAAGVGIASARDFGTLSSFNDTLVVLAVSWDPQWAPSYALVPPAGVNNPLAAGGTCGALCIDLAKAAGTYDLAPGDLVRLQVNSTRRLLLLTDVQDMGTSIRVKFLGNPEFLHYKAAFSGGVLLDRFQTTVQKLNPVVYFANGGVLYRAQGFNAAGAMVTSPMAQGVSQWHVWLVFTDLHEATSGSATDADATNDFDELLGVRVAATVATTRVDMRVKNGAALTKSYQWRIMPRNLMYERNR